MNLKNFKLFSNRPKLSKKDKSYKIFVTYPAWKAVLTMAIPAILSTFFNSAYTFLDSILMIKFGSQHIGGPFAGMSHQDKITAMGQAVGIISPISSLTVAITILIIAGSVTSYSNALGRKNYKDSHSVFLNSFVAAFGIAIVTTILLIFIQPYWYATELSKTTSGQINSAAIYEAKRFVTLQVAGFIFNIVGYLFSVYIRSEGKPIASVSILIIALATNIGLDFLFLVGLKYDALGAGWAIFTSYALEAVVGIVIFMILRKDTHVEYRMLFKSKISFKVILKIFSLGLGGFIRNFSLSLTGVLSYHMMSGLPGYSPIVSDNRDYTLWFARVNPIMTLFYPPIFGIIRGGQPLLAYNYGAKNYNRIKQIVFWICIMGMSYGIFAYFISSFAISTPLFEALSTRASVIPNARHTLQIVMSSITVFGISAGGSLLFQCTGDLIKLWFSSSLRGIITFIPMVYLFNFLAHHYDNADIYFYSYLCSSFITAVIIMIMTISELRRINKYPEYSTLDLFKINFQKFISLFSKSNDKSKVDPKSREELRKKSLNKSKNGD